MTTQRIFLSSSKLTASAAVFVVLNLLAMVGMVLGQPLKPASVSQHLEGLIWNLSFDQFRQQR